ncbi:MAG TPA: phosphatase PAP2 family protein [Prolixibacteraceae bacterium]|nr:phosphatase PAP2 family protein [Prolixibacteraceae bacterium]
MEFFEWLNQIDTRLFLFLNGANSPFFDTFFTLFTSKEIWVPFYLVVLLLIFRKYRTEGLWIFLFIVLAIVLNDQLSGIIKDIVQRIRPSHEATLAGKINLPAGAGGLYSFVSSHASNSFCLAVFLSLLIRQKSTGIFLFAWATLTAYSRVYVGVHYPFDILAGALLGGLIGWGLYRLLALFDARFREKRIEQTGKWSGTETLVLKGTLLLLSLTMALASFVLG